MGFRSGAYATVWDIQPKSPGVTTLKITISKKPKGSDEYITDFSGFCSCLGATAATAAKALTAGDRIKLGDVEVVMTHVKKVNGSYVNLPKWEEGANTYTNFNIYSFEKSEPRPADVMNYVDPEIPNIDEVDEEEGLPF